MFDALKKLFGKKGVSQKTTIVSPDRRLVAEFEVAGGILQYRVNRDGRPVLGTSRIGFELKNDRPLAKNLAVVRVATKFINEKWETVWGEEKTIVNNYNEAAIYLTEIDGAERLWTVRVRVFNEGVAWRYEFPAQPNWQAMEIVNEYTEFAFDSNSTAWWIPAYQPDRYEYNYTKSALSDLSVPMHTPLTLRLPGGFYAAVHEAALYDYAAMTLRPQDGKLVSDLTPLSNGTRAALVLPAQTPWRMVEIGQAATDLMANRMMLNLNEPCKLPDTSWVQAGKFMGIWWTLHLNELTWGSGERQGITTARVKEYIDACAAYGVPVLLLEGWNVGWDGDWMNHGENFVYTEPVAGFDLDACLEYARQKNVKLMLHHETSADVANYERQLDAAYAFLRDKGVHYLKTGYVGSRINHLEFHHSQIGVRHYQRTVELAAANKIMLDIHEPIKGTGIERTWPNLMTREGARGQEYEGGALSPNHATIIPFTRGLAGGFDYTPGVFDVTNFTKRVATTIARQLAYYVVIFSSMQMVSDRPQMYKDHPLFRFIQLVPTSWERSLYLLGDIGEYVVVARQARDSGDWFIGGITNENPRRVNLFFDFLEKDARYQAEIYRDDEGAHYRDNQLAYKIETCEITAADHLSVNMASGGGFAIYLKKL
ncbi:MAG: glycoside hydrolase family 97 protein [Candidatus Nomurabacteria bacterium]|jgi:alpha-glucosidase|nr:glycoside hydrolase family 97 protein [Candidatus Nomurabacteria bacterium]